MNMQMPCGCSGSMPPFFNNFDPNSFKQPIDFKIEEIEARITQLESQLKGLEKQLNNKSDYDYSSNMQML